MAIQHVCTFVLMLAAAGRLAAGESADAHPLPERELLGSILNPLIDSLTTECSQTFPLNWNSTTVNKVYALLSSIKNIFASAGCFLTVAEREALALLNSQMAPYWPDLLNDEAIRSNYVKIYDAVKKALDGVNLCTDNLLEEVVALLLRLVSDLLCRVLELLNLLKGTVGGILGG